MLRRSQRHWLSAIRKLPFSEGEWRYSRYASLPGPAQGWKIHVSATVLSAAEVFARCYPVLRKYRVCFKVPGSLGFLASLNSGLGDFSQVGKFLTVYPSSIRQATELARKLHDATRGLEGPRIPFDAVYRRRSLVHYRYGAFRRAKGGQSQILRGPRGERIQDKRAPGKAVPSWVTDPFVAEPQKTKSFKFNGPIGVELIAFNAKMQRGKGGVYEALDLSVSPPRVVIIKEGRRHGETDWLGKDGYARVKQEGRVLRSLQKAGLRVPQIFREFVQDGNRYLVLERIAGRRLIPKTRVHPRRHSWRRAARLLNQLERLLCRIHEAGWVWRDCKPSHIFVHRGQFRVIDFEDACRIEQRDVQWSGSKHYSTPRGKDILSRRAGVWEDDYALGVIAFQFGIGKFPPGEVSVRAALYKRTKCPSALREKIEQLLTAKIARRLVK
jgi:hypothetical protein